MKNRDPIELIVKVLINLVLILITIQESTIAQINVNKNSVALFDSIPENYKLAASDLRMMFMDRSVGANIYDGLTCLSYTHTSAPNHCKRYEHGGIPSYPVDPSEVYWDGTWDCSNWRYQFWPDGCDNWNQKVICFIEYVEQRIDSFDVVGFQFSYLEVSGGSTISDPVNGFFGTGQTGTANHYLQFQNNHPDKKVIWFTSSLARSIGTPESESFNAQLREYANNNNIILFDVADILSHTPGDSPCYDNRDGVAYSFGNNSENHADDSLDIPAICPEYTTETEGGHLGAISAGKIRVAKAFWVLMARIAGWDGVITSADENTTIPNEFILYQNYPNPFNPTTKIKFTIPKTPLSFGEGLGVRLLVYDVLGNEVAILVDEYKPAGSYEVQFDTSTLKHQTSSGIYFYRLSAGDYNQTKSMILIK